MQVGMIPDGGRWAAGDVTSRTERTKVRGRRRLGPYQKGQFWGTTDENSRPGDVTLPRMRYVTEMVGQRRRHGVGASGGLTSCRGHVKVKVGNGRPQTWAFHIRE